MPLSRSFRFSPVSWLRGLQPHRIGGKLWVGGTVDQTVASAATRERKVRTPQDRVAVNGGLERSRESATENRPPDGSGSNRTVEQG